MTLISQDGHFTAGAGAVCGSTDLRAKQSKPWLVSLVLNDSYTFTWLWYPTMWKRRTFFANFCVENNWCQFLKAIIAEITSKFFTRIIIEKDRQRRFVVNLINVHHRKRMISKSRCLAPTCLLLPFTLHPPIPEKGWYPNQDALPLPVSCYLLLFTLPSLKKDDIQIKMPYPYPSPVTFYSSLSHPWNRMISKSRCLTPIRFLLPFTLHPSVPEINLTVKSISGYRCSG